jgi:FixJ family two-component response regulator
MDESPEFVAVVDDDVSVRESLPELLKGWGLSARGFSSAQEFLDSTLMRETQCLVLDIAMAGMSGPDLQQELQRRHQDIPIVFITAKRDDRVRPRLLARGAVECLYKPFNEQALRAAINTALNCNPGRTKWT